MASLSQKLGRTPTDFEVAKNLGWDITLVEKIKTISLKTVSLDDSVGNDDEEFTRVDTISDKRAENPETTACNNSMNLQLRKDMNSYLTTKEQLVLRMRFGFDDDGSGQTLEEVGQYFSVTRERIRQIENTANTRKSNMTIRRRNPLCLKKTYLHIAEIQKITLVPIL